MVTIEATGLIESMKQQMIVEKVKYIHFIAKDNHLTFLNIGSMGNIFDRLGIVPQFVEGDNLVTGYRVVITNSMPEGEYTIYSDKRRKLKKW